MSETGMFFWCKLGIHLRTTQSNPTLRSTFSNPNTVMTKMKTCACGATWVRGYESEWWKTAPIPGSQLDMYQRAKQDAQNVSHLVASIDERVRFHEVIGSETSPDVRLLKVAAYHLRKSMKKMD